MKTNNNYSTYFAIEKKLRGQGFHFDRADLIDQFTDGKYHSLKELSAVEYGKFIEWLNEAFKKPSGTNTDACQQQRRKIIAILSQLGFVNEDGKANMDRIYQWVLTHGYLKKSLNTYSPQELPKLVYQAEQFYKSTISRI